MTRVSWVTVLPVVAVPDVVTGLVAIGDPASALKSDAHRMAGDGRDVIALHPVDVFVFVVVLILAAQFSPNVISETIAMSLLVVVPGGSWSLTALILVMIAACSAVLWHLAGSRRDSVRTDDPT